MFSYTQFLVTGFTVNHPESPETVAIDMRDIGPTYYFAPPRVLEDMPTRVMIRMVDASWVKRTIFAPLMARARRTGVRIPDGVSSVTSGACLLYSVANILLHGPLSTAPGKSAIAS